MVQFLKNLEDSENFKRRNIEVQRYFKILAIGLKGIADVRTGKPGNIFFLLFKSAILIILF